MGSKSRSFRITPRAYSDLIKIGEYTQEVWGTRQRNKYLKELDAQFKWLAKHPYSGKHRLDIKDGYYCFLQGSHLVFYLIYDHHIDIIGIPHKSMDIENYF